MQGDAFVLWDFSVASDFVNEVVPLTNPKQQMKWFWEPAHYKKELGDILLTNLLVEQNEESIDFGIRLSVNNITDLLRRDQASLQEYLIPWGNLQRFIE
jgi:hypothetical protein